jgi:hypothetical protein
MSILLLIEEFAGLSFLILKLFEGCFICHYAQRQVLLQVGYFIMSSPEPLLN